MTKHQCSMSLQCKSEDCIHARPHDPRGCDCGAPCGCWPGDRGFQPMVICIPADQVKPRGDCTDCGKEGAEGHHPLDCVRELKRRLANA